MPLVSRLVLNIGYKVERKKKDKKMSEEKHVFGTPGNHPGPERTANNTVCY